ncbi:hypothetical protein [Micromonospora sp. NPDC049282]|uniref:hypothetical protein n=1 Tax=Micromonospora sp. NPDC049282 TaxID=3364269 RepID=UPI00371CD5B2
MEILVSRGVPAGAVALTLDHYGHQLRDFPRASGFLDRGRAVVGGLSAAAVGR